MMPPVNLMPAPRRLARQRRCHLRGWAFAGGLYACTLAAVWIAGHATWGGSGQALASEQERLLAREQESQQALDALEPRWNQAQASLAANHSVAGQPDWALLLSLLADQLGDRALFTGCQLAAAPAPAAGYRLQIDGLAHSTQEVSAYLLRLEQLRLFEQVKLIETSQRPFASGQATIFRIECHLGGETRP